MKLNISNGHLPVLGYRDMSECSCYEQLAEDMENGEIIIYNTIEEFEDEELCAFIFYDDYSKRTVYSVFSGKVEFIGRHPDHEAPFAYIFIPDKEKT
jgi:hypothetical protein